MTTATKMMICMIFRDDDDDDSSSSSCAVCPRPGFYFDASPSNLLFNLKSYQYYSCSHSHCISFEPLYSWGFNSELVLMFSTTWCPKTTRRFFRKVTTFKEILKKNP